VQQLVEDDRVGDDAAPLGRGPELPATDVDHDAQHNHTIAGFLVWTLPILRGDSSWRGRLLGGWSVTANGWWSFGNEGLSVFAGYDANANGYASDDLAEKVSPVSYPRTPLQGQGDLLYQWFDPSAFAYPGATERGFSPVTSYTGHGVLDTLPSSWTLDTALLKDFRLHADTRLQLRLECYNVFNHANLNWPIPVLTDPNFGKIRGKRGDGRRMQLGVRLQF